MRTQNVWTSVLTLTAKDDEYDQTDAFDLRVFAARLRTFVRRGAPERPVV
jgi:two-component system OmpR family response regulator